MCAHMCGHVRSMRTVVHATGAMGGREAVFRAGVSDRERCRNDRGFYRVSPVAAAAAGEVRWSGDGLVRVPSASMHDAQRGGRVAS